MAKILKNIKVDWNWVGDAYALKGFNIAITPSTGTPHTNTVMTGTAYGDTRTYTFDNIVLDDTLQYTAWVQCIYKDKDSPWINTASFTVSDNGGSTIETKSSNVANTWTMDGDTTKIDGGKIYTGTITADAISTDTITAEHIQSNVIYGDMIVGKTITGDHIASNVITAEHIGANSITANEIQAEAIESKHIKAGGIDAGKINAYGLSVLYEDALGNTHTTFNIASDGQVSLEGKVKSFNYSSQHRTGWQISPEGDAEFNGAVVRGVVELPNAGMTNEYDMHQAVGKNLLKNSKIPLDIYTNNDSTHPISTVRMTEDDTTFVRVKRTTAISGTNSTNMNLHNGMIKSDFYTDIVGREITVSFKIRASRDCKFRTSFEVFWGSLMSGTKDIEVTQDWQRVYYSAVLPVDDFNGIRFSPGSIIENTTNLITEDFYIDVAEWMVVEGLNVQTPYIPAPEDVANPVRIWAGASVENKYNAPFRIHQNGDMYASNVYLTGLLEGDLISDDLTITNSTLTLGEAINISATQSIFDTDMTFGSMADKRLEYYNTERQLNLLNTGFKVTTPNTETKSIEILKEADGNRNGLALYGLEGGSHCIRESSSGTLLLDSYRQSGTIGDFAFQKNGTSEGVKVHVGGELEVVGKIGTTKNDIEMRATSTGWAFYAG